MFQPLVFLQFLFVFANAQCSNYQNMFNYWNVISRTDASVVRGEFEGRTYVAWNVYLSSFTIGRALTQQCSTLTAISANYISASEGNFCGTAAEANDIRDINMANTGSNINCDWQAAGTYCNPAHKSPLQTVSFSIFMAGLILLGQPLANRVGTC
jgi:hypothetical protein